MDTDAKEALWGGAYAGAIVVIGWCFFQTFTGWDRNLDGVITISDWRALLGAAMTRPYEWAHSLFPSLFQFFELPRPADPTWRTALAGAVWAYVFAMGVVGALLVAVHTLAAFVVHWRGGTPPS